VFHWAYPPVVGGVETHLASLLPALAARGHSVTLCTGSARGAPAKQNDRGVAVRRSPLWAPDATLPAARLRWAAAQAIEATRPDLLHVHNLHYFSPPHQEAWLEAAADAGVPVVFTVHNVWRDDLGQAMARALGDAAAVIAVSAYMAAEMVLQGVPASRVRVIHHGTPLAGQPLRPPPHGPPVVFHPARLSLDKGSLDVVEAFGRIARRHPRARLRLCGTGAIVDFVGRQAADVRLVRERIAGLGLTGRVSIGPIAWSDMPRALARSHVVLYPSRFEEPFGLAALEGMAVGRPVVVTSMGGLPEFVTDGEVGSVVPPADPEALADAIDRLLHRPALGRALGREGHRRAGRLHSLGAMVEATEEVYHAVVANRGGPEPRPTGRRIPGIRRPADEPVGRPAGRPVVRPAAR
jgi:glycosyltransferase involved in cell wall biosynthesis